MTSLPTFAGIASTMIFAWSVLPMLARAHRTRDLCVVQSWQPHTGQRRQRRALHLHVQPPGGSTWARHSFYLTTSWLMLIWCLR